MWLWPGFSGEQLGKMRTRPGLSLAAGGLVITGAVLIVVSYVRSHRREPGISGPEKIFQVLKIDHHNGPVAFEPE